MVGGNGNDTIKGGNNRDFLIGGLGADALNGRDGDDILLAGDFAPNKRFDERQDKLRQLLDAWLGPDPYAIRVAALQSTILASATDDDSIDILIGGDGQDWFVANIDGTGVRDLLTDRRRDELISDLT